MKPYLGSNSLALFLCFFLSCVLLRCLEVPLPDWRLQSEGEREGWEERNTLTNVTAAAWRVEGAEGGGGWKYVSKMRLQHNQCKI